MVKGKAEEKFKPQATFIHLQDLSSTGYLLRNHSFHPPFRAETLVNPSALSFRATLALVYSLGQAQ
jgi:hypothetical protein